MAGEVETLVGKPKFYNRSSFIVCGSSRSGKTEFVLQLIRRADVLFQNGKKFHKVLYCYSTIQDALLKLEQDMSESVVLHKNLPSDEDIEKLTDSSEIDPDKELLIVLDDLMYQALNSQDVSLLFTSGRHKNITIIFVTQSLFEKGRYSRTIALNTCYVVLFKNRRDHKQVRHFASQMYSKEGVANFMEAYQDATAAAYEYLVVDIHSDSPDHVRIRSKIFPEDDTILYKIVK